ncbi:MAG: DUF11 domain-containing protein, partial [Solirubrobacteraceae bacterium]
MGNPTTTGQSTIQRISLTGQAPATFTVSTPAVGGVLPTGQFGAAWTYGNGDVGFSNNNSGNIYEIRIGGTATSPTFTTVISQSGPGSSNNDGTNAPGLSTDLAVTKTASPAMVDPGGKITYTLTVTNNGPGNSSGYVLTDTLPPGVTNVATTSTGCSVAAPGVVCAGAPLAAGASVTDTITVNAPNPFTAPITNTASVTANESDPNATNNSASATVSPNIVTVSMVKSAVVTPASDQNAANVGDTIQYSYTVTNTGNVPLTSVAVSDPTAGSVACPTPAPPGLARGATETCVARTPYLVKQTDVDVGSVTDTATATGTDATNFTSPPSASSSTKVRTVAAMPSLLLQKVENASLGDSTPIQAGETAGDVSCPALTGAGLAPGASVTCTQDIAYEVTQSDVDAGSVTDVATATGTATVAGSPVTSPPSLPDSVTIEAGTNPAVSVVKSATVTPSADQNGVKPGDQIQYSYLVTNVGNTTLKTISVSDPTAGSVTCPPPAFPGLAPGSAETCTAAHQYTVTQADVDNGAVNDTATATGVDLLGISSPAASGSLSAPAEPADPELSIAKHGTVTP